VQLIEQNEYGAFLKASLKFTTGYPCIEDNPNFSVFQGNQVSLVIAKCSRVAGDDDIENGRYGIDFHRSLPSFQQARQYAENLPQALMDRKYTNNYSFSAQDRKEYLLKKQAYDSFYSYIHGTHQGTVYVVPHCGDVHYQPDNILPRPKLEIDSWTAGLGAICVNNTDPKNNDRIMVSLHSNGYLGAAIDIGSFGLPDYSRLVEIANNLNQRYQHKMQRFAEEYYLNFLARTKRGIKRIWKRFGTLHPTKLKVKSRIVSSYLANISNGLNYYRQNLQDYTEDEFLEAFLAIQQCEVPAVSVDTIYSGKHVGNLLNLQQKIESGVLDGAIQIECAKVYLNRELELMAQIILDLLEQYYHDR